MPHSLLCQWCMRYDCVEKGGSRKQCPVEDNVPNDDTTFQATVDYQRKAGFLPPKAE